MKARLPQGMGGKGPGNMQSMLRQAQKMQEDVAALQQEIAQLRQKNAESEARCQAYETSLEGVLNSSSWKLTLPLRRLLGLFRRS